MNTAFKEWLQEAISDRQTIEKPKEEIELEILVECYKVLDLTDNQPSMDERNFKEIKKALDRVSDILADIIWKVEVLSNKREY